MAGALAALLYCYLDLTRVRAQRFYDLDINNYRSSDKENDEIQFLTSLSNLLQTEDKAAQSQNLGSAGIEKEGTFSEYAVAKQNAATVPRRTLKSAAAKKSNSRLQQEHRQEEDNTEATEEEKNEPDKLSLLLQQTTFSCAAKSNGYYADDQLNCQVFHYCSDKIRHSWVCPDGLSFHQIHLICMQDSENICARSSQYHFVNDYLYKPINLEESIKSNKPLEYSDRYYPQGYQVNQYDQDSEGLETDKKDTKSIARFETQQISNRPHRFHHRTPPTTANHNKQTFRETDYFQESNPNRDDQLDNFYQAFRSDYQ